LDHHLSPANDTFETLALKIISDTLQLSPEKLQLPLQALTLALVIHLHLQRCLGHQGEKKLPTTAEAIGPTGCDLGTGKPVGL
jgi:hypothetical protein